ncbi:thiosulfate ABC transporter substrate-binding protein CysP [Phytohalomonas tamaricis]|uniref:thiosulfate ABC transporter substrate-binding protein CysP n=1 Tax=Phytohalomonas tamaricis TaxID=2081032 RepID=UPI000D0AC655|nr:thiosulfate ABC transporter substrate-binding protein CysP [Phytohalomonas tamaricis]
MARFTPHWLNVLRGGALVATLGLTLSAPLAQAADRELLNTSYDIARELFAEINPQFVTYWKDKTGEDVEIKQSHAGSSKQARAIMQGLRADVVTFNQVTDVDVLAEKAHLIPADWQQRLPNHSSPYYSTMAFLVRKGNPKHIESWQDLAKQDVKLVFPNPKTSGNARYTYLAAWAAANDFDNGDETKIRDYMKRMLGNVAVFDTGGRGATTTFVERGIGDVLITFESEVNNIRNQYGKDDYEVVVPKTDILAEFPVTWIDEYVKRNGTEDLAKGYLNYLYSDEAQRTLANFYYRVNNDKIAAEFADRFPETKLLRVEDVFGSWQDAMATHFSSGGELDQLLRR